MILCTRVFIDRLKTGGMCRGFREAMAMWCGRVSAVEFVLSRWRRAKAEFCRTRHGLAVCCDCETFRIPSLMSKRTIRIPDEGGYSGVGGT